MKLKNLLAGCLLVSCSTIFAVDKEEFVNSSHWAIQGAIVTGGVASIGIAHYSDSIEFGAAVTGAMDNDSDKTSIFTPVIFGGWRKNILENTYFAFGLNIGANLGEDSGENLDPDIFAGPYISLEQQLTSKLLLVGWIDPYNYEYRRTDDESLSINRFFNSGGIALNYYFS